MIGRDRQARDLPLDAHLHTDLSPDSDVADRFVRGAGRRARDRRARHHRPRRLRPVGAGLRAHDVQPARARRPRGRRALGRPRRGDPVRRRDHLGSTLGGGHPGPPGATRLRLRDRLGPRLPRLAVRGRQRRRLGRGPVARRDRRAVLRRGRGRCADRPVRRDRPHRLREALPRPARDRHRPRRAPPSCTSRSCAPWSRAGPPWRSTRAACGNRPARRIRRRRSSPAIASWAGRP